MYIHFYANNLTILSIEIPRDDIHKGGSTKSGDICVPGAFVRLHFLSSEFNSILYFEFFKCYQRKL